MQAFKSAFSATLVACATGLSTAPASAAVNLIANGGFCVSCQTDSWAVDKSQSSFFRITDAGNDEGFLYVKDAPATISQDFYSGAAGDRLTISFDYELQETDPSRTFSVLFNGQTLFSTSDSTVVPGALPWASQTVSAVATGYDRLSFVFDTQAYAIQLDNVSATISAVPESSSWAMLGAGLAAVAWVRRRQPAH